jgi:type IV pilus assembly protein PilQ
MSFQRRFPWRVCAGLVSLAWAASFASGPEAFAQSADTPPAPTAEQPGVDLLEKLQEAEKAMQPEAEESQAVTIQPEEEERPVSNMPDSPPDVKVTDAGAVQMHVSDVPLAQVLRALSLESRRNIIASPRVTGMVTASLYDVTFEEALQSILMSNGAGYRVDGKFIYVYTTAELAEMELVADPPLTKVFPLSYVRSEEAAKYVAPLLGAGGSVIASPNPEKGIASNTSDAGGDNHALGDFIVVTARSENLERVAEMLARIDVRPHQVLIEATMLRARLDDENALGIDFNLVGGVDLELLGATSNAIQDITLGTLPTERYELFNSAAATDFRSNVPAGGLSVGIIKDNVAVFIRALESVTDTAVLANPKVLVLNKQRGQVIVGRRDGYLTTTVTETTAIQQVEFLETGTQLIFRPFVGEDGFVRIELYPKDSVGVVSAQGLPSEQTTEVTTNVLVKDGNTVMIGGLFREVTTDARSQVPGLGNLPFLGQLFRSNNDTVQREEVIVLLTVHIVKDHDRYATASADLWERMERGRVGLRQGLMWHGRDRLAQSHYQAAVEHYHEGDLKKARWHVDLALRNSPVHTSAIELRDMLTGERAWEDEGAASRGFIYELINREKSYGEPIYERPLIRPLTGAPTSPNEP